MTPISLRCEELTKIYGSRSKPAVDGLSLVVNQGEIFTLLGRNGAGKTTFLRIAATQLLPTKGKIEVLGSDVVADPASIRPRIAVTPQEGKPLRPLTVWDHVYYWLLLRDMSRLEARVRTHRVLKSLELEDFTKAQTMELSGGQKQKVLIAMAIATDAEFLFLDEPTLGLDPVSRRRVWTMISELHHQNRTILLTTHYLDEAEALSDRLAVLDEGKLIAEGSVEKLKGLLKETTRIDFVTGFEEEELATYGRCMRVGDSLRVLTTEKLAAELVQLALARRARFRVSPTSLDDVFVSLVETGDMR